MFKGWGKKKEPVPDPKADDLTDKDKSKDDKTRDNKTKDDKAKNDKAKEDKAKEDKAKEDKAKEDKAKEDKAKEDKAKEDKAKEDKAKEDKSKEDKAKNDKAKADETKDDQTKPPITETNTKNIDSNLPQNNDNKSRSISSDQSSTILPSVKRITPALDTKTTSDKTPSALVIDDKKTDDINKANTFKPTSTQNNVIDKRTGNKGLDDSDFSPPNIIKADSRNDKVTPPFISDQFDSTNSHNQNVNIQSDPSLTKHNNNPNLFRNKSDINNTNEGKKYIIPNTLDNDDILLDPYSYEDIISFYQTQLLNLFQFYALNQRGSNNIDVSEKTINLPEVIICLKDLNVYYPVVNLNRINVSEIFNRCSSQNNINSELNFEEFSLCFCMCCGEAINKIPFNIKFHDSFTLSSVLIYLLELDNDELNSIRFKGFPGFIDENDSLSRDFLPNRLKLLSQLCSESPSSQIDFGRHFPKTKQNVYQHKLEILQRRNNNDIEMKTRPKIEIFKRQMTKLETKGYLVFANPPKQESQKSKNKKDFGVTWDSLSQFSMDKVSNYFPELKSNEKPKNQVGTKPKLSDPSRTFGKRSGSTIASSADNIYQSKMKKNDKPNYSKTTKNGMDKLTISPTHNKTTKFPRK